MFKIMNKSMVVLKKGAYNLPSPSNISYLWNFGSLLGLCLVVQLMSGVFLSMHYSCSVDTAFDSVNHLMRDVNLGWMLRVAHANGSSFFFVFLYLHISRGIYYKSFLNKKLWVVGVVMLLMVMGTAFLGYVLPWGQMSFWGATVITNLASAIPIIGNDVVFWLWGGFSISNATLTRFFSLHFVMPFLIVVLSLVHLAFLHESGSSNILGFNSNLDKIPFHPYFSMKDLLGVLLYLIALNTIILYSPWLLMDPENFIPANSLNTPRHIQPEWYFLFAYAILRSIPNKLGGVMGLASSVLILAAVPFYSNNKYKNISFSPLKKIMFWIFINNVILLTWIGSRPVEYPYSIVGQFLTFTYFSYFMALSVV